MSYAVWRFEYSVQQRIAMLRDILKQSDKLVPSQIKREWLYRAQLVLEPVDWNALWRLSRESCQQYGVRFPCIVYVLVEGLELNEDDLFANITVIGVQDESVHLPEKLLVPLIQLWPTLGQQNNAIEIRPTAEFIDHYRYFYTYIWMPWDLEEDEQDSCWFELYVPSRCNLWADAYSGRGCSPHILCSIRDDGEIIRKHIAHIEESISSDNEEDIIGTNAKKNVSILVSLHDQLQALSARWKILQNPSLQELWNATSTQEVATPSEITIVWCGGTLQAQVSCLNLAEEWLKSKKISLEKCLGCFPSLASVLNAKPKQSSIILLCEGSHSLPRNFSLGKNYLISSLTSSTKCSLKCPDASTTAFPVFGSSELNGLTVDPGNSSTGFAVRMGCLTLRSCIMKASPNSYSQATVVFENGEIVYKKCKISGFFTGIIAYKGSKVKLVNCVFENCGIALQIYEDAVISLSGCKFKDCKEYAIRYDTPKASKTVSGGTNILSSNSNISITDCTFSANGKNEVYITPFDEHACLQLDEGISAV